MITPAISVLSAVEGLTTVQAGFAALCHPDRGRHPGRPVRHPVARHGQGRAAVRPDHAGLFRDARGARRDAHRRPSGGARSRCSTRSTRSISSSRSRCRAFIAMGSRRAGGDRRRGALRRHGPFRPPPDQVSAGSISSCRRCCSTIWGRARCCCRRTRPQALETVKNPFFFLAPETLRLPLVHPRDRGDDHRQPGGDFRRLLGHPAGDPAGLHPAPQDHPHQRAARPGRSTSRWSTGR